MGLEVRDRVVLVQLRMALACIVLAVLGGVLAVLHYIPSVSQDLSEAGVTMSKVRPLHTTFASVWIFGAAIAVVYHFLSRQGSGLDRGDLRRFWFHTVCWLAAGVGILISLCAGVMSGREYLGFHPAFSVILLAGWFAFAINVLRRTLPGFWHQPVYAWFWTVGALFFIYTFVEGHSYLLPWVADHPIRDLQLQWKSCGTLVGSFNFLVYGSLIYVSERLSGDRRYGQSTTAFLLFGVGCLNSFTNFAHHTYHLPQTHVVKWIAFIISMMEAIILLRVMLDIIKSLRAKAVEGSATAAVRFLNSARWWTAAMLFFSILISVPSLNSLIHGTHVVTGHAMGTELGIDTMILFGAIAWLLTDLYRDAPDILLELNRGRRQLLVMNLAMTGLVLWLLVSGTVHGLRRYLGQPVPDWVSWGRVVVFPLAGAALAASLLFLIWRWARLLFRVRPAAPPASVGLAPQRPIG